MFEQPLSRLPGCSHPTIAFAGEVRELWRMRGATDDLSGFAIETSFGHALALELDHELVLLHLQPSLDALIDYSDRIETALLAQGWRRVSTEVATGKDSA